MDFALGDEQQLLVSTIRRMVDSEIMPHAAEADRLAEAPASFARVAADVGFFIDALPADRDGLLEDDYSHLSRALRSFELGRGCAGLAALLESNVEPCLAVGQWGSGTAQDSLFGSVAAGGISTVIRDFKSTLTVTPSGDGAIIDGTIGPTPAAAGASHLLLLANLGEAERPPGEPLVLLVPVKSDGVAIESKAMSGWRAARWAEVSFNDAHVTAPMIVARGDSGASAIDSVLSWYRTSLAARAVGVATAAMANAASYGAERVQFDQPIGAFESIARLRDANETRIAAARLLVLQAAAQLDAQDPRAIDTASRARDFAAEVVSRASIDAVQIYGGYGFVNDFPVEKLMRDARAFEVVLGRESLERTMRGAGRL